MQVYFSYTVGSNTLTVGVNMILWQQMQAEKIAR